MTFLAEGQDFKFGAAEGVGPNSNWDEPGISRTTESKRRKAGEWGSVPGFKGV